MRGVRRFKGFDRDATPTGRDTSHKVLTSFAWRDLRSVTSVGSLFHIRITWATISLRIKARPAARAGRAFGNRGGQRLEVQGDASVYQMGSQVCLHVEPRRGAQDWIGLR